MVQGHSCDPSVHISFLYNILLCKLQEIMTDLLSTKGVLSVTLLIPWKVVFCVKWKHTLDHSSARSSSGISSSSSQPRWARVREFRFPYRVVPKFVVVPIASSPILQCYTMLYTCHPTSLHELSLVRRILILHFVRCIPYYPVSTPLYRVSYTPTVCTPQRKHFWRVCSTFTRVKCKKRVRLNCAGWCVWRLSKRAVAACRGQHRPEHHSTG